jgi:hypothetical protein
MTGRKNQGPDLVRDAELRRLALQIVIQLPADTAEARRVLRYTEEIVSAWLNGSPRPCPPLKLVD